MARITLALALLVAGGLALGGAAAAGATGDITLTIEKNQFAPEEIRVKAGEPFVLVITNRDKAAEEFESLDLRIEKVIPAGKTVRLKLPPLKPGTYGFAGEYHEQTAKGRIVAE